eukprot:m.43081 g.43081  ORF g.43081 m.43081 type:complete len:108 (+) comp15044_c0_seq9:3022-3345(+)
MDSGDLGPRIGRTRPKGVTRAFIQSTDISVSSVSSSCSIGMVEYIAAALCSFETTLTYHVATAAAAHVAGKNNRFAHDDDDDDDDSMSGSAAIGLWPRGYIRVTRAL